ncbi:MAG: hypothetical protein KME16_23790 [Scytolyngbya sp. HA4215-MV1]|jgi:hypothetical protein|nr:hypothetical protein [Scytolyngbya sp. HA4215-MV1]
MERGLLWLPLLGVFFWLAWSGWNEYQKVEAYRIWAQSFERAKYDIYAVLGQKGNELTWGKPNRHGPIALQTFSLEQVTAMHLRVDGQIVNMETPPEKGRTIALEFTLVNVADSISVPFTETGLASQWGVYLQNHLQGLAALG